MKTNKILPFGISLQFFASDEMSACSDSASLSSVDSGLASLNTETEDQATVENNHLTDSMLEEEFESLIKGGKYENAFKKRTQSIIDKRFKNLKGLEEKAAKNEPILNFLSEKYGIDSSNPSLLLEKMQEDSKNSSELTNGKNAELPESNIREQLIKEKANRLSKRWAAEGEELKKHFPDFDFRTELKNPLFAQLLKSGLPLRKAYTASHSDEILRNAVQGTAKKVAEQTLKSIRAQGSRVAENGLHNGAGFVRKTDVSSLTGEDIRNIIKQVENGSKIRF